ncbi:CrcB family protein [Deinococcus rubellus]|uniref:Fluoride-specific ion channel FluC n=1 Tax=Deinococcus rubellus TaxID=1889240 RepID=A0ABY5YL75_9DEIO|nr:fluoride efflux transporter CrcB [Deinococcus rubellus]UWX65563.1 fluoride efflux transporter CrcB [Deinococcus rubellus]
MLLGVTWQGAILVALGGAVGALARYGLSLWIASLGTRYAWATFPMATLLINVTGAFALGYLLTRVGLSHPARAAWPPELRLALGTGFLGAYTTFSTFSVETNALMLRGEWGRAALYVLLTIGFGLAAAVLGRVAALR